MSESEKVTERVSETHSEEIVSEPVPEDESAPDNSSSEEPEAQGDAEDE